jgi:hypothetical protein
MALTSQQSSPVRDEPASTLLDDAPPVSCLPTSAPIPPESRLIKSIEVEPQEEEDEDDESAKFKLGPDKKQPQPASATDSQFVHPSAISRRPSEASDHKDAAPKSQPKGKYIRRDSQGKLRYTDDKGEDLVPVNEALKLLAKMDEHTQKSTMSLTQENSESAYEHLDIQRCVPLPPSSPISQRQSTGERHTQDKHTQSSLRRQHNSARTDSTAHTYKENDTGHITLTYDPEADVPDDEPESQDASYATAPRIESFPHGHLHPYEPETPAPPKNPFSHKGSVLKGHEMFGATQPSVGRTAASPTSSRPSPDVYNDFTSPRNRMLSSPLIRRRDVEDVEEEEEVDVRERTPLQSSIRQLLDKSKSVVTPGSPLQSSIRQLLDQSKSVETAKGFVPRMSGVQSFDTRPFQRTNSLPEPRKYNSMKESQERRMREEDALQAESSGSDSDIEADPRSKRAHRERAIKTQLAAVRMPSSRPSSSSGKLESDVPAAAGSGRRHSIQDDYLAQTYGTDARDTQQTQETTEQDEFVADSQGAPRGVTGRAEPASSPPIKSNVVKDMEVLRNSCPNATPSGSAKINSLENTQHDSERIPATETEPADQDLIDTIEPSKDEPEPSLPLQELDSNRRSLQTPVANKNQVFSDGADDAVPETSPSEDRVRPMGEIGLSFGEDGDDEDILQNPPGFTQDLDFLSATKQLTLPLPRFQKSKSNASASSRLEGSTSTGENQAELKTHGSDHITPKELEGILADFVHERAEAHDRLSEAMDEQISNAPATEPNQGPSGQINGPGEISEPPNGAAPDTPKSHEEVQKQPEEDMVDVSSKKTHEAAPEIAAAGDEKKAQMLPKRELRTKTELKGPSRDLRRSTGSTAPAGIVTRQSSKASRSDSTAKPPTSEPLAKSTSKPSTSKTIIDIPSTTNNTAEAATPRSTPQPPDSGSPGLAPATRSSQRQATMKKAAKEIRSPLKTYSKRTSKRKSGAISLEHEEQVAPSRSSKRQSIARTTRESSEDPLALASVGTFVANGNRAAQGLFSGMAFAVSYVNHEEEKNGVMKTITDMGGEILEDGFECLFEIGAGSNTKNEATNLSLTPAAKSTGFTALIADEHSRKTKYMQALALGLPCISGRWISACVSKGSIVDWAPYLLCAGQSKFLGNAHLSRALEAYPAAEATLDSTFASRSKMLEGKSVLLVSGKSRADTKRKAFIFLTRAMGPDRVGQVADYSEARKKLVEGEREGRDWDLLFVDASGKAVESTLFGANPPSSAGSRKRKRGPTTTEDTPSPAPKKIRLITDEDVVQSLIFGQLIEQD